MNHHQDKATFLERLIFNNRPVVIALCALVTMLLLWQASHIRPSTSFEKMIRAAVAEFPNFKVAATTLRKATTATFNDWSALLYYQGQLYQSMKRDNLEIYDRVGGGDGFASGVAYGFLEGKGPQAAVEYGAAHGALAMTTPGDTSMVRVEEVEAAMKGKGARVIR